MQDPKTKVERERVEELHCKAFYWLARNATIPTHIGVLTVAYTVQQGWRWMAGVSQVNHAKAKESLAQSVRPEHVSQCGT